MSRYARVTIYDKNTGKYLGRGGAQDPRIQTARNNGHIIVQGANQEFTKWDFTSGSVVADLDRQQAKEQSDQQDAQANADRRVSRQWLRDNTITAGNQLTALTHIQTILK